MMDIGIANLTHNDLGAGGHRDDEREQGDSSAHRPQVGSARYHNGRFAKGVAASKSKGAPGRLGICAKKTALTPTDGKMPPVRHAL
jgi:hypothetical protein